MAKDWLYQALKTSNVPKFIREYDAVELIQKSMLSSTGTFVGFEILLCATALFKTGNKKDVEENRLDEILLECEKITKEFPGNHILSLISIKQIRSLRPSWFSWPIYFEILKPFNKDIQNLFKTNLEEITKGILQMSNYEITDHIPKGINALLEHTKIKHSDITSLSDLWNIIFIELDDTHIVLTYKLSEVIYNVICRELQKNIPKFGTLKGKYVENFVTNEVKKFFSSCTVYHKYFIDKKEKDIILFNQKFGCTIECKSMNIRPSSIDWSVLNAIDDTDPIMDALNQLIDPIKLLEEGGIFFDENGKKISIRPKEVVISFVITDQIYASYIRAAIDEIIIQKESPLKDFYPSWHGGQVWIGSIIDLYFLLCITQTPSILIDYFTWIRSEERLKWTDEPEAWLSYCTEPYFPFVKKTTPIANVVLHGFKWDIAKKEGLKRFFPFWIERPDFVKNLDKNGNIIQAINIVKQERGRAYRMWLKKYGKISNLRTKL